MYQLADLNRRSQVMSSRAEPNFFVFKQRKAESRNIESITELKTGIIRAYNFLAQFRSTQD